ncbi:MAG: site-specific integrase [Roseibium sp.]
MSRPRKAPRLALRNSPNGATWIIRDGATYIRTGCAESDTAGAEKRLIEHITAKYQPSNSLDPQIVPLADALNFYATYHIPTLANPKNEAYILSALLPFWGDLYLSDVKTSNGKRYTAERMARGVKSGTARRELKALQSAVNMYARDRDIPFVCRLEMPQAGESRLRWLTRREAAAFIQAARRRENHHVARILLIGIYTGTRINAIRSMRWVASIESGYFDLEQGVMYRKGAAERSTTKRRPSVRIPSRLLPHLKRWREMDGRCTHVIHRNGTPMKACKRAWSNSRDAAELDADVVPHTMRHTAASWGMQNVETPQELQALADFLGMSLKMLLEVYGHLNPLHQKAASDAISRRPGRR